MAILIRIWLLAVDYRMESIRDYLIEAWMSGRLGDASGDYGEKISCFDSSSSNRNNHNGKMLMLKLWLFLKVGIFPRLWIRGSYKSKILILCVCQSLFSERARICHKNSDKIFNFDEVLAKFIYMQFFFYLFLLNLKIEHPKKMKAWPIKLGITSPNFCLLSLIHFVNSTENWEDCKHKN